MPQIPYARQDLRGFHDLGQSQGRREYDENNPASGVVSGIASAVGTAAKVASMFAGMGQQGSVQPPSLFPTGQIDQAPNLGRLPGSQDLTPPVSGLPALNSGEEFA